MPQQKIKIRRGGVLTIEGEGYTGKACDEAINKLIRRLGVDPETVERKWKPEADLVENVQAGETVGE